MNDRLSCRLCFDKLSGLNKDSSYMGIYGLSGVMAKCAEKIQNFLHLDVDSDAEFMSKLVCFSCWEKLEAFSKFYDQVNEIQEEYMKERFRQLLPYTVEHEMQLASPAPEKPVKIKEQMQLASLAPEEPVKIKEEPIEDDILHQPDQILNDSKLFTTTVTVKSENEPRHSIIPALENPIKLESVEHDLTHKTVIISNGNHYAIELLTPNSTLEDQHERPKLQSKPPIEDTVSSRLAIEVDLVPGDWRNPPGKLPVKPLWNKCIVESCNVSVGQGVRLFRCTTHYKNYDLWIKNCRITTLSKKMFVCERHFESKYIKNRTLLKTAVPTLHLSSIPYTPTLRTYNKKRARSPDGSDK